MKKAKKKGPAPKGRRSAAPTKKKKKVLKKGVVGYRMVAKKPFRLEVGKTYENRTGLVHVRIISLTNSEEPAWAARGEVVKGTTGMYNTYWCANGLYHPKDFKDLFSETTWLDLIREVPPPKSPKGRGK